MTDTVPQVALDNGRNEEAVGRAIADSGIPRDELFVTTKLWVQDPGEDNASAPPSRS